jgi:hypothetical protein
MSLQEVTVRNDTAANIWVIIAENGRHVIETTSHQIREYDFETYYKMMVEGKAALPIEGVPIDVSGKESHEFKARLKTYWEDHQEAKFEWSGFVEPGELEVPPGRQNRWALKGDELPYYISVRTMQGRILANAVARQDKTIVIDKTGHIDDPVPVRKKIANKANVYLQKLKSKKFAGDPQTSSTNWDAGTFVGAGGSHKLVSVGNTLEAGAFVRIQSNSKTLASGDFKYMYSSDIGWIYYDKARKNGSRAGKKQLWKISKTSHPGNSPGATLHYGDQVVISNGNWPKANLGIKKNWLQCVNADPTVWVLREEARA